MFKFDGVAGDPRELAVEMEAMLSLIKDLRTATTSRNAKIVSSVVLSVGKYRKHVKLAVSNIGYITCTSICKKIASR